jgi:hypothetical protein
VISAFKKLLATSKNSANPVVKYGAKLIYSPVSVIRLGKKFYVDEGFRNQILLRLKNPFKLQQLSTYTEMNRYPLIFSACRDYFGDKRDLKILSYGCSTGEEVLTLREYFPAAFIIGAEINPQALAKCKELQVDDRITFVRSGGKIIKRLAPFDAIFCMAVLQRNPHTVINENISNLKRIYPFSKFSAQVGELDACLNDGGLLIIHHTQYLLGDTSVGSHYEPLEGAQQEVEIVPRFDKNSNRKENLSPQPSIFIKKMS